MGRPRKYPSPVRGLREPQRTQLLSQLAAEEHELNVMAEEVAFSKAALDMQLARTKPLREFVEHLQAREAEA